MSIVRTTNYELITKYIDADYYELVGGHGGGFWVVDNEDMTITVVDEFEYYTEYSAVKVINK